MRRGESGLLNQVAQVSQNKHHVAQVTCPHRSATNRHLSHLSHDIPPPHNQELADTLKDYLPQPAHLPQLPLSEILLPASYLHETQYSLQHEAMEVHHGSA